MKNIELLEAFETEIGMVNNNVEKPLTIDSEYFVNLALELFYKTRYSGMNAKQESFEQSQKRIDDLRTLIKKELLSLSPLVNGIQEGILPSDYVFLLGDRAGIKPADGIENECWPIDEDGNYILRQTDTIEGTIDTIDRIRENSLSEYHLHYTKARPIRLIARSNIELYTDGDYQVGEYEITYLRRPQKINFTDNNSLYVEYTDMPLHTLSEIIKLAARLYMLNKADVRYESQRSETDVME